VTVTDRKTSLELDESLWRRVRVRAAEEDISLKELLSRALESYLRTKHKKGGKRGAR
jgi:hypothetical protein